MEEHYRQAFIKVQRDRQKLIEQNKRYREALETIRNMFPMRGGTSYDKLSRIREVAEKALEARSNK